MAAKPARDQADVAVFLLSRTLQLRQVSQYHIVLEILECTLCKVEWWWNMYVHIYNDEMASNTALCIEERRSRVY